MAIYSKQSNGNLCNTIKFNKWDANELCLQFSTWENICCNMIGSKISNKVTCLRAKCKTCLKEGCCLDPWQLHHYKHRECVWDRGFQCVEHWANLLISKSAFREREHNWETFGGPLQIPVFPCQHICPT